MEFDKRANPDSSVQAPQLEITDITRHYDSEADARAAVIDFGNHVQPRVSRTFSDDRLLEIITDHISGDRTKGRFSSLADKWEVCFMANQRGPYLSDKAVEWLVQKGFVNAEQTARAEKAPQT